MREVVLYNFVFTELPFETRGEQKLCIEHFYLILLLSVITMYVYRRQILTSKVDPLAGRVDTSRVKPVVNSGSRMR